MAVGRGRFSPPVAEAWLTSQIGPASRA
jgi:hypothetical protein